MNDRIFVYVLVAATGLTACGSSGGSICTPGVSVACVGAGGCSGGQVCESDGKSYGTCTCGSGAADNSTGSGGANSSSATNTTGAGSTGNSSSSSSASASNSAASSSCVPIGQACTSSGSCCQTGTDITVGAGCLSSTVECTPRCNTNNDCPSGSCCIANPSSFPSSLGGTPGEPGGWCVPESNAANDLGCITGNANGYVCTGNGTSGFDCTASLTTSQPSVATCMAGETAFCGCNAYVGSACSSSEEIEAYAECIDGVGASKALVCLAPYAASSDTTAGCNAAVNCLDGGL